MQQRLNRIWYEGAAGAAWLAPLAGLYGAVIGLRRAAYRAGLLRVQRAPVPVVVVGNLTAGGTGKTPLVAHLARELAARGVRPGIASRGYGSAGGAGDASGPVDPAGDWRCVGDEPLLLARLTGAPVMVNRERAAAAAQLARLGAELVICDDGLQHLALARDLEIIVIDGARGLGNGRLLPAGPLRERPVRLAGADLIVVNGTPAPALLELIARLGGPVPLTMQLLPGGIEPVSPAAAGSGALPWGGTLAALRGRRVHAVAGIGNPRRFFELLGGFGVEVVPHAFPDHHPFAADELRFGDGLPVLMTEKDAMRCAGIEGLVAGFVPVTAQFGAADAAALAARLQAVLARVQAVQRR